MAPKRWPRRRVEDHGVAVPGLIAVRASVASPGSSGPATETFRVRRTGGGWRSFRSPDPPTADSGEAHATRVTFRSVVTASLRGSPTERVCLVSFRDKSRRCSEQLRIEDPSCESPKRPEMHGAPVRHTFCPRRIKNRSGSSSGDAHSFRGVSRAKSIHFPHTERGVVAGSVKQRAQCHLGGMTSQPASALCPAAGRGVDLRLTDSVPLPASFMSGSVPSAAGRKYHWFHFKATQSLSVLPVRSLQSISSG